MKRRDLLVRATALGTAGVLAGCVSRQEVGNGGPAAGSGDDGSDGETDDGGSGGSDDGSSGDGSSGDGSDGGSDGDGDVGGEENPTPAVVGQDLTRSQGRCIEGDEGGATVSFTDDGVQVSGGIRASDPCHVAQLAEVQYSADEDELVMTVGVEEDEEADVCMQCVGIVEYEATVSFEDGLPGQVTVSHLGGDGPETVATESR